MTLIVVIVAAIALFFPTSFSGISTSAITPLLGVVMFGMGLTLRPSDFKPLLLSPKDIIIGEVAQFVVMPSAAWFLCNLLELPPDLALGVILVGCCPGGTASNVICFIANGDVPLSVAMTAVSTLLAPFVTPALVMLLAGESVDVDAVGMFLSIAQVIILPIAIGFAVNHFFSRFTQSIVLLLPTISKLTIAIIIGIVVSHNAANIVSCSLLVAVAVVLHNALGLAIGYLAGLCCGLSPQRRTSISLEVGMQNSGLATALAATHFALFPLATVPGAIFSAWHNISGSIAAQIMKKHNT